MKNLLLTLLISFTISFGASSQSNWSVGNYYAYQGQSLTQTYFQWETDVYFRPYYARYCRVLTWYQEYREGYIYFWNSNTGMWYTEYKKGYFWYCYWSAWQKC